MTTINDTYQIRPIEPEVLATLRVEDDSGRSPRLVVDAEGGSPLRCCLEPSRPGETLALVSFAPLRRWALETGTDPGAYDELGPVFIHPTACAGYAGTRFPDALRGSRRVLRAYRADGSIAGGRLVEPAQDAETYLEALFEDPEIEIVHARAVEFGCFTFEARRTFRR
jgi:hypothetical protein